ncbi:WGR domain-containing protein [Bosea sp. TAF32]|uniref:WGR domain-containing protein n=1 Tax=Bosea sp. TAF32 TaxID=3237482 RepID=UPI003F90E195
MLNLIVLDRIDRTRDMHRFYVLSIEPTLWGELSLVRQWGRIGRRGRSRVDLHCDHASAREALDSWLERKRGRGYVPRQPTT